MRKRKTETPATTTPGGLGPKPHTAGQGLVVILLAMLIAGPGVADAKQARAALSVSATVLSACTVNTDQPQAPTCQGSAPPVVEQREQRKGDERALLTVVTF
ncbi:hypothetical protein SAMN05216466_106103 [Paraburkholderia phenazinium]|uniref:Uncharacterized protein n=1 Tax=Paraburkholderia phenazinium TaxID=60549 RepID=A0A1G7YBI6_9BURK|nr:hypothetical protein [Paraburkholderia phenazinium]SDG93350.1 hypothetical protein SAMN05216466_106103 [Paraburkholderia phenazinium]